MIYNASRNASVVEQRLHMCRLHLDPRCNFSEHGHIPKLVLVILLLLIILVAVVGNTLVVVVIVKVRRMQTFMNWMIFNLAVCDLLTSLLCLCIDITTDIWQKWVFGPVFCPLLFPLRGTMIFASVFTLVSLSLSRYWAIAYPFKTQPNIRAAKICMCCIWFGSLLMTVPYMVSLRENKERGICEEVWSSSKRQLYTTFTFILMYVLPLAIITWSYSRIVDQIVNIKAGRKSAALCSAIAADQMQMLENRNLVRLAIIITATFSVCVLPSHVMWVLYDYTDVERTFVYFPDLMTFSQLLLYLNSALNPINYNVFSSNFRTAVCELFRRIRRNIPKRNEILATKRATTKSRCTMFNQQKNTPRIQY